MPSLKKLLHANQALPALDWWLLLGAATGQTKEWLLAHDDYRLTWQQRLRLAWYRWRYQRGFSVAAIIHQKEFFGLNFYVNRRVLVPRPETEVLVSEALKKLAGEKNALLIDVGCGSGCIPIAVAKDASRPLRIFATDISRRALRVAKRNARTHGAAIKFFAGDLLAPILKNQKRLGRPDRLLITANLPYLTTRQWKSEPSIQREPYQALVADSAAGLTLYRLLLSQLTSLAPPCPLQALLEFDPAQTAGLKNLVAEYAPAASVTIIKDLAGNDRVLAIEFNNFA